ncbi:hypothetical protein [Belliella aquatica]|uniref:Uncharacterized protein n=1 Tax=Belliella aquatica TaxID=1323734 RepID=A0ABQ1MDZ4_9BACT|nr:hypothetical protein [Belliella aquatica]MCH7405181.1 hypothetical protein [Belliella aquatica]GGC39121.1 hypothetical protein GCM10010993_17340 [Belliella aquatica]
MRLTNTKYIQNSIPNELKNVIIKALDFYPDLVDVTIEFKLSENIRKSVMQAQPKFNTMLGSRKKRAYIIKISRFFSLKGKVTPIHELPENVLVGWIGHELGHVIDYLRRSNWSMLVFGVGYLTSRSFIISAERAADTYAVNHGLGKYILTTKEFILHEAGMSDDYIKKINKLYLPPEEIMYLMENIPVGD